MQALSRNESSYEELAQESVPEFRAQIRARSSVPSSNSEPEWSKFPAKAPLNSSVRLSIIRRIEAVVLNGQFPDRRRPDENVVTARNRGHYMLSTDRRFRDLLRAKGYDFHFEEFGGVHRELSWQSELAKGLISLGGPR